MPKVVTVTEEALREMVKEVLDNKDLGTVLGADEPVEVNATVDPSAVVTDPINPSFTPQDKVEFDVAVRNLVKNLPDDKMPSLYKQVKQAVDADKQKEEAKLEQEMDTDKKKEVEEAVRRAVRRFLNEKSQEQTAAEKEEETGTEQPHPEEPATPAADAETATADPDETDSVWDPDAEADEDERMEKMRRAAAEAEEDDDDGMTFKQIDQELGTGGIHNARQEFNRAILKARFMANMDPDDRDILVYGAMKDYVQLLASSGELSPADIQLLHDHPDIVKTLDGFREFLHTYIKRAGRGKMRDQKQVEGKKLLRQVIQGAIKRRGR